MLFKKFIKNYFKNLKKKKLLILSGGKSVKKIYYLISTLILNQQNTDILTLDERVSSNLKFSNYIFIKKIFIKNCKVFSISKKTSFDLKNIIKKIQENDALTIMGIGDDGHFASIFSHSKKFKQLINLKKKPNICNVEKIGKPYCKRTTMNLSMISLSSKIILVLNNKKKLNLLVKFIKSKNTKIPVNILLKKNMKKILIFFNNKLLTINKFNKIYAS